jgi:poly-gamma-glutamate synthesis protein (capsule biosynthesis protein)
MREWWATPGRCEVQLRFLAWLLSCTIATGCRPDAQVSLIFAGDMMLGRAVEAAASARGDWALPFRRVAPRLQAADVAFGNLECVAATSGPPTTFRADPRTLEGLREAGFDVVSLANNHAADAGIEALAEMASRLGDLGIAVAGLRYPPAEQRPSIVRAKGLRVGFLAYSWSAGDFLSADGQPAIARTRREEMVGEIAHARSAVDYLVVSLHMGADLERRSGAGQQEKARAAVDAGADLVVGHHPHVPQEVERYGRGFIAYSLGDFVFDHPELSVDGALLEVTLVAGRPVRLAWRETRINPELQPEVIRETVWAGEALTGPNASLN